MQDPPDRKGAELRQAVGGSAQGVLQSRERPGRRAIAFAVRGAAELGQNALALGGRVLGGRATAVPWCKGQHAFAVAARHQFGHRIVGPAPASTSRRGLAGASGHGAQERGALDMTGRFAARAADLLERVAFLGGKGAQGI